MAIQKITSGIIQDGAIVAADIVSIANTQITGNIVSSQITSVANTQITGNIVSSQITSVANTQISGNIISSQITSVANTQITGNITATTATTATNLAGGSNGTIPYQTASGATSMLSVGTSGQLLQTNGAGAPSWATVSGSQVVLLATVTAAGSSTVDFLNSFSSAYDTYYLTSNDAQCTSSWYPTIRLAVSGSAVTSASYFYFYPTIGFASWALSTSSSNGIQMPATYANASTIIAPFWQFNGMNASGGRGSVEGQVGIYQAQAYPGPVFGGLNDATGPRSGCQIVNGGQPGVISGTFKLYGLKNT